MQTSFGCVLRSLGHFLPQKTSFFAQNAHLVHAEDMYIKNSNTQNTHVLKKSHFFHSSTFISLQSCLSAYPNQFNTCPLRYNMSYTRMRECTHDFFSLHSRLQLINPVIYNAPCTNTPFPETRHTLVPKFLHIYPAASSFNALPSQISLGIYSLAFLTQPEPLTYKFAAPLTQKEHTQSSFFQYKNHHSESTITQTH